tara:strand:+ start:3086 stop:3877 length:792 start_codon:yes stop_codon:yes gene_type:complete
MKLVGFYLFLLLLSVSSCKEEVIEKTPVKEIIDEQKLTEFPEFNWDTLKGTYFGDFSGSDIRITITFISNKHVVGYNVYKGLVRNLSGNVTEDAESIMLYLEEPGDNKFDGIFQLNVNKNTLETSANWDHFGKTISSKYFDLHKLTNAKANESFKEDEMPDNSNFHEYFYYVTDSIGKMTFSEKGLVTYSFYPNLNESDRKEQLIEIRGSFSVKDKAVIIDWQPNEVFPSRHSIFQIILPNPEMELYEPSLKGESRNFFMEYY